MTVQSFFDTIHGLPEEMEVASAKPDYGIDAPGVIAILLLVGAALLLAGLLAPVLVSFVPHFRIGSETVLFPWRGFLFPGVFCFGEGLLMIYYSKRAKFRLRDRMLNMLPWKGLERVLDVGTGRGLLMIGAAKRLTQGRATGIDIWSSKDLSGNSMENTRRNAELEGVRERVEVLDGDATAMKFADATFDVIVSNACLHNIPSQKGREQACREIIRVLKPGGTALVCDFIRTGEYLRAFRAAGANAKVRDRFMLAMRIIEARK